VQVLARRVTDVPLESHLGAGGNDVVPVEPERGDGPGLEVRVLRPLPVRVLDPHVVVVVGRLRVRIHDVPDRPCGRRHDRVLLPLRVPFMSTRSIGVWETSSPPTEISVSVTNPMRYTPLDADSPARRSKLSATPVTPLAFWLHMPGWGRCNAVRFPGLRESQAA